MAQGQYYGQVQSMLMARRVSLQTSTADHSHHRGNEPRNLLRVSSPEGIRGLRHDGQSEGTHPWRCFLAGKKSSSAATVSSGTSRLGIVCHTVREMSTFLGSSFSQKRAFVFATGCCLLEDPCIRQALVSEAFVHSFKTQFLIQRLGASKVRQSQNCASMFRGVKRTPLANALYVLIVPGSCFRFSMEDSLQHSSSMALTCHYCIFTAAHQRGLSKCEAH